jgi:hypothetical protein
MRQYQLIFQFRGDSIEDYDSMIAIENELIEVLGDSATVDGHDVGSGETNIFILTSDPEATLKLAKPMLERTQQLQVVTVAYRQITADEYTVIWPEDSHKEFTIG